MLLISIGILAGIAMIASLSLRPTASGVICALLTNVFFIVFAAGIGITPVAVLHGVLLLVNLQRLAEARADRQLHGET